MSKKKKTENVKQVDKEVIVEQIMGHSMQEIFSAVKARVPIIWVVTHEEDRFLRELNKYIAIPEKKEQWIWSAYQGLVKWTDSIKPPTRATGEEEQTNNPQRALNSIIEMKSHDTDSEGFLFVMRDMHTVMAEPIPRQLRDMYEFMILDPGHKTIIITSPSLAHGPGGTKSGLPPTLEKQISVIYYELPKKQEIKDHIKTIVKGMVSKKKLTVNYTEEFYDTAARALQGLTTVEYENSLATCLVSKSEIDIKKLISDKKQIIRKSDILEFIDTKTSAKDVGGLDLVKFYIEKYTNAHTDEAKAFGAEPLDGVILTGVPGTGKSLLAKAIGNIWNIPVLRLDVGKVMTGLVGGSESKMREAISQTEAMAPCILWIDEVEKSLSGTKSSNFSDGGTLSRVFSTLLLAMEEGMEGVTIIATANDITQLAPEFIRRFNEVFFVDLPGPDERWEIFTIHLHKKNRNVKDFEKYKEEILLASENYTGAEIEKAVKGGIIAAFHAGKKDLDHTDLLTALKETKPIAKIMKRKIEKLRREAKNTYRFASSWAANEASKPNKHTVQTGSGKTISVDDSLGDLPEFSNKKKKKDTKPQEVKAVNRFDSINKKK